MLQRHFKILKCITNRAVIGCIRFGMAGDGTDTNGIKAGIIEALQPTGLLPLVFDVNNPTSSMGTHTLNSLLDTFSIASEAPPHIPDRS